MILHILAEGLALSLAVLRSDVSDLPPVPPSIKMRGDDCSHYMSSRYYNILFSVNFHPSHHVTLS